MKLKKKMEKKKMIAVLAIAVAAVILISALKKKPAKSAGSAAVMEATVSAGTVQTTVAGTGTLSYAGGQDIILPESLEIDTVFVGEGDRVEQGQVLATVKETSLYAAIAEVENAISGVNDTMNDEKSSSSVTKVTAGVSGRVKKIYAVEGADAGDVVAENGALMLVSTDGQMQLLVKAGLAAGDTVTVTDKEGEHADDEARVESVTGDGAIVVFDDSLFAFSENLVVKKEDKIIGTGTAEIHQPVRVLASEGSISSVPISENQKVSSETTVCVLKRSSQNAEYMQALKEREELEFLLASLYAVKRNGGITAEMAGTVQSVQVEGTSAANTNPMVLGAAGNDGDYYAGETGDAQETGRIDTAWQLGETERESAAPVMAGNMVYKEDSGFAVMSAAGISAWKPMQASGSQPSGETAKAAYSVMAGECNNGTVLVNGTSAADGVWVPAGDTVSVSAEPEQGYELDTLEVKDGSGAAVAVVQTGTAFAFVMPDGDVVVDAVFKESSGAGTSGEQPAKGGQEETADKQEPVSGEKETSAEKENTAGNGESAGAGSGAGNNKTAGSSGAMESSAGSSGVKSAGSAGTLSSVSSAASEKSGISTMTAFTLASGSEMKVTVNVDELDILSVEVGKEAEVTLDAVEGEVFAGTITSVGRQSSSSNGVAQYPIEITFAQTDSMLEGMNASVSIVMEKHENTLVVPAAAVMNRGNASFVYTGLEGTDTPANEVEVTTGLSDDSQVEIVSGLSEGDTVYYQMAGSDKGASDKNSFGGKGSFPNGGFPDGSMPGNGSFDKGGRSGGFDRGMTQPQ